MQIHPVPYMVPGGLIEVPHRDEIRNIDRGEYALALDDALRQLAHQEARCRLVFGQLARVVLARRANRPLGFVRVGDYARERLGWSGREVQDAAHLVTALEGLPRTAAAFRAGALSWTKARVLASVASDADEERWLKEAQGRTVRALEARIKATREASDDQVLPALRCEADCEDDTNTIDGEEILRFRIRCPRRVRAGWRYVVELAERMCGSRLSLWRAADAISAEGMSAARAGGSITSRHSFVLDDDAPPRTAADADEQQADYPWLEWSAPDVSLTVDVEQLASDASDLDPIALDGRLCAVVRAMRGVDWRIGRLLRTVFDLRLNQLMGFPSRSRYVRERLGISPRKARMLVAVERQTWHAPALLDGYRKGDISALRALALRPILDERVAEQWIQRAREVTLRRLIDEVGWALDVRDAARQWTAIAPPPLGAQLPGPARQMRAPGPWEECCAEVTFVGPVSVVAMFRATVAAFTARGEPEWRGFERLIEHARVEWESQPRHRDPIFERDRWLCTVPACSARSNMHDHHIVFRSRGGSNVQENRTAVCADHHLQGVHYGWLKANGRAPDAIYWQLGVQRGRRPFLEFLGDRYLDDSERPLSAPSEGRAVDAAVAVAMWCPAQSSRPPPRPGVRRQSGSRAMRGAAHRVPNDAAARGRRAAHRRAPPRRRVLAAVTAGVAALPWHPVSAPAN